MAGCGNTTIVEGIKSIAHQAFLASSITHISIPASVTQIAEEAFSMCRFCSSIEVCPNNPVYDSRSGCNAIIETATGTLVQGCGLTTFPSGVSKIGNYAFDGMTLPTNYDIPEGITSIGEYAFEGCNLSRLRLPSTLKEIRSGAFRNCLNLEVAETTSPALHLGQYAFEHCTSLYAVRLPLNVTFEGVDIFRFTPYQEVYEREYGRAR